MVLFVWVITSVIQGLVAMCCYRLLRSWNQRFLHTSNVVQLWNAVYSDFDRWLRRALDILESEPQESLELARSCPQMSCRFPYFWWIFLHQFLVELSSLSKESYKSFLRSSRTRQCRWCFSSSGTTLSFWAKSAANRSWVEHWPSCQLV